MRHSGMRARIAGLVATGGLALVLAACGGGDSPDPTETSPPRPELPTVDAALVNQGETLFGQFNCAQCHSVSGQSGSGPALGDIYGTTRTLDNGETVLVDDAYLAESITDPNAKIVEGYPRSVMAAAMSNLQGDLAEPGVVDALVAYIASLQGDVTE